MKYSTIFTISMLSIILTIPSIQAKDIGKSGQTIVRSVTTSPSAAKKVVIPIIGVLCRVKIPAVYKNVKRKVSVRGPQYRF